MPISVIIADITQLRVDAIVNAANPTLLGGGGVDGAIHRAAGPALLDACRALPEAAPGVRCPTGEARITPGFALPARHVIHTVGPIWHGGSRGEPALLESCYRGALQLLHIEGSRTLTTPPASESHRSVVRPAIPAMPRSEVDVRRLLACRLTPCDRHVL